MALTLAPPRDQRGIALGLVLWVLVIGSAMVTIATFIGAHERRAEAVDRRLQRARTRAEVGLTDALTGWTPGLLAFRLVQPFDSLEIASPGPAPGAWWGTIRRLSRGIFLIDVTATDPPPTDGVPITATTRSRQGWLVRVRPVSFPIEAAFETGAHSPGGDAVFSGADAPPAGWSDCPGPDSAVADLQVRTDTGFPSRLVPFYDRLVSQATLSLGAGSWATAPRTSGERCVVNDPYNWGTPTDPASPCGAYWPIVRVAGDLGLDAGSGHGILLVDGNLTIRGRYRFAGIVMVRGRLAVESPSGEFRLEGVAVAGQAGSDRFPLSGVTVTYSKCMVSNALLSSGVLIPLRSRGWKLLF